MSAVPLPREVAGGPAPARGASPVLCTLVLCDLVDSTALVERLGDQAGAALMRRHDRLARDLMHRHGGREIDKTDGFLVLFERPIQGVAFALDYQRELRELGKEQGFALRARAGIHVGDGDTLVENAAVRAAPGGFSTAAELVIFTTHIVGNIDAASAAAQIGSATSAYAIGADVLFVVDNGTQSGIFRFHSSGNDALVSAAELTQVALVNGDLTGLSDYSFGP